ncbi:MAG: hypothetical protein ACRDM1_15570 [Gaiellaceae bacterium]
MSGSISTNWLSARLGRDPGAVESARREGRLLGVRTERGYEFPAWQFGRDGEILPSLPRVIAAARAHGMSDERLAALLQARSGLGSDRRLSDALRDGNVEHVLAVIHAAST